MQTIIGTIGRHLSETEKCLSDRHLYWLRNFSYRPFHPRNSLNFLTRERWIHRLHTILSSEIRSHVKYVGYNPVVVSIMAINGKLNREEDVSHQDLAALIEEDASSLTALTLSNIIPVRFPSSRRRRARRRRF